MLLALLANPKSGRGDARDVERVLSQHGADVIPVTRDRASTGAVAGAERVVVAGGDGSIGPAAEAAAEAGMPLAVIPVGTANDFARALGIPLDAEEACRLAARGTQTRRLELAWIDSRPFVNAASAGLAPVAARKARGLKRALGSLAYTVGAVRAGLGARPVRCRVHCEGEPVFEGDAWQVTVAVTGAFGGGASVDSDPRDGKLDIVVIEAGSRVRLVAHAYRLRAGGLASRRAVRSRRCGLAEIETDGTTGFNVDGEIVAVENARFRVDPEAFEVVTG